MAASKTILAAHCLVLSGLLFSCLDVHRFSCKPQPFTQGVCYDDSI
jgi:hypothetical protein